MTLRDHGFKLDIRRLDLPREQSGGVPEDLDDVHGVVSLGGHQNVGENHWWMRPELELIKAAHTAQLPVIGVCLGCQMIGSALGGEVAAMAAPEVGFTVVSLTPAGQTDRVLSGQRWRTHQFQSHAQEVKTLPPGATLLGSSAKCKAQVFKAGLRTYAFQYHMELDRRGIDGFLADPRCGFGAAGLTADLLSAQCDEHYPGFARLADRLCVNIATLGFAFNELLRV